MATTRAAKPVRKPVKETGVSAKTSAAKKSTAKKSAAKKSPGKKSAVKRAVKKSAKPKSTRAIKQELAAKREAAVEKGNQTIAATNHIVGAEPVAVDPGDEVA